MSKFILFTNGVLSARYDSAIHGDSIPVEAVEVDDALFFQTINEPDGQWTLNADGSIAKEPLPPAPLYIPSVVTMRQARLALLGSGLLTTVNNAVAAMTGNPGEAARIEWEYATEVRRDSPLVDGLSAALSLDAETLDSLFTTAASL
jgi:hypothetical protein